jgi:hypothetical protein
MCFALEVWVNERKQCFVQDKNEYFFVISKTMASQLENMLVTIKNKTLHLMGDSDMSQLQWTSFDAFFHRKS